MDRELVLPLVGREVEVESIRHVLQRAESGAGGMLILTGNSGEGKTRLLQKAIEEAEHRQWTTAVGRAYPVESGIPYAPFADAFHPILREMSTDGLATLTRGTQNDLAHIFPILADHSGPADSSSESAELKPRLLWNFSNFLKALAARRPLVIVLDDLQWADASSIELLHFVARQIGGDRVMLLCAYNSALASENPRLTTMAHSLQSIGAAMTRAVGPLSKGDTATLIRQFFGVADGTIREFAALLYGWTRGNAFFLQETLKTLVGSGRLRQEDGVWVGWDMENLELPGSIREVIRSRLQALSSEARSVAGVLSVFGTSIEHEVLRRISEYPEVELVRAVGELRRHHILKERLERSGVVYDFSHPLLRETLHSDLGLARSRLLHEQVAEALEQYLGDGAGTRAGELAYHYSRANRRELAPKALHYLTVAGRDALRKHANGEAVDYLSAALEHAEAAGETRSFLVEELARGRQRLGDFAGAAELWRQRLAIAEEGGDTSASANAHRRLGLIDYIRGAYREALSHYEIGLAAARSAGDETLEARLHLARGECYMELGRSEDARSELNEALGIAERASAPALLARVHVALLLLHTWVGPPETARDHGRKALAIVTRLSDSASLFTAHWGLAILSGFTGDAPRFREHIGECDRLADELRSPLHWLRAAEPAIEFMANTGEWSEALERAERAIATARALNQRSQLARLLVWSALIHLARGDLVRGKRYVDEAWELSGAGQDDQPADVHTAVPAHVGIAAFHLAMGDFVEAARVAERGLVIADRTGYTAWAIHRLLPTLAEAYLFLGDVEGATRVGERLRSDSQRLGHELGLAWAEACEALLVWMRGDTKGGIVRLRAAAERLEAVPAIPDASRVRRHFAARLRDNGEREAALQELRHIHEVFVRLGAERELAKTREQIRELGARPPVREAARGLDGLSDRELEIARLVVQGKSNKSIAKALDISSRTVSTHLTNIFGKVAVSSRGELGELMRRGGLKRV